MPERDVIKSIIDFAFITKAQLHSDESALLRSILTIAIMEAEDLIEKIDDQNRENARRTARTARR